METPALIPRPERTLTNGEPFEYTGTGLQLFLGFAIVLLLIIAPFFAINIAIGVFATPGSPLPVLVQFAIIILVIWLSGIALYRARRYRLGHTNWRSIRGAMTGAPTAYGAKVLGFALLLPLTLGFSYPWQTMVLNRQLFNDMAFGDRPFRFFGRAGDLYKPFFQYLVLPTVILLFLAGIVFGANMETITSYFGALERQQQQGGEFDSGATMALVIGLVSAELIVIGLFWVCFSLYKLRELQVIAASVSYEDVTFRFVAQLGALVRLVVGNFLIALFTLGLGMDFATLRTARFFFGHLESEGSLDLEAIRQSAQEKMAAGEGLAEAFDVDAF